MNWDIPVFKEMISRVTVSITSMFLYCFGNHDAISTPFKIITIRCGPIFKGKTFKVPMK